MFLFVLKVFCLFVLGFLVCLPRRSLCCVNRNMNLFHMDILKYLCLNYSHVPSFVTSESLVCILEGNVEGGVGVWGGVTSAHDVHSCLHCVCSSCLSVFFSFFSLSYYFFLETAKDQAMMMAKYLSISNQYLLICNLLYTVLLFLNHVLVVSSVESLMRLCTVLYISGLAVVSHWIRHCTKKKMEHFFS